MGLAFDTVKHFLDEFEKRSKLEQDSILVLAWDDACPGLSSVKKRREFVFLEKPMRRVCFQLLLGVSSHRVDKIGQLDQRYGKKVPRPTALTASIDSFSMVLYNSIAEPLPTRWLTASFSSLMLRFLL